jgi:Cu/Ag efflux pump CusA
MRRSYVSVLGLVVDRPWTAALSSLALFVGSALVFANLGSSFLPPFNEGSLVISVAGPPGMSMEETHRVGTQAESLLLELPEIDVVTRRSGRAELDEHAQGVNSSEIDAPFALAEGQDRGAFFDRVREALAALPGVNVTLGQPISHRIDHMLSGTRANIAVKIFGDDLGTLRRLSAELTASLENLPELSDVTPKPQIEVPEIKVTPRREQLAAYGLTASDLAHFVERGIGGHVVGEVFKGTRQRNPIVVRLDEDVRTDVARLGELTLDLPSGERVPLSAVATLESTGAAYAVSRENVERKAVIAVNMAEGVDLGSAVAAIESLLSSRDLPTGYRVELGGQYESVTKANQLLMITAILAILVIFMLLQFEFRRWQLSAVVLLNLPMALIGGIAAIRLTDGIVSIASVIGLISLFGIATRNGILLVSRYEDLAESRPGLSLRERLLIGAGDRLNPIVMTALSTALALIPLALNAEVSGNEIQSPMAVVILGGLLSATLLNLYVIPAIYAIVRPRLS